jgi:hypothetical protein
VQQADPIVAIQNIAAQEPPMQQVHAIAAEPDFLDEVDLSSQNQEIDRQLLAKELFDEFAILSDGPRCKLGRICW